jgi:hypothetical protein
MAFVFKDGASSTLVVAISNTETSMVLESVASFPQGMIAGDHTVVTISNSDNTLREVVKVTAINYTTKTLTVQRGYDSTIALNWPANSKVEIRAGSTLLKELGISYSPKVLLGKKIFPTSFSGAPSGPVVHHLNEDTSLDLLNGNFRKYRIEIQSLVTNGNSSSSVVSIFPTIFTPEPRGISAPSAGIYPKIINNSTSVYAPQSAIAGFTETRFYDGSNQAYRQTNFGGYPLIVPPSSVLTIGSFDTIIDINVQRKANTTNNPEAVLFRIKMNVNTTGYWNFSTYQFMHNMTCDMNFSNVDSILTSGPVINTGMKLIGFTLGSPLFMAGFGGADLPSATLYGIR